MSSKIFVGLDLGTLSTKIMLARLSPTEVQYELVRTSHGSHALPSSISFARSRARMIGEDSLENKCDENTVCMLDRLLVDSVDGDDVFGMYQQFNFDREKDMVYIPAVEGEGYSSVALMAMLLGRVKRNVLSTMQRLEGNADVNHVQFVFAVPPNYSTKTRNALMDAAYAASVPDSICVDSTVAFGKVLQQRKFKGEDSGKKVLVVDMGHSRTNISLLKVSGDIKETADGEKEETNKNDENIVILANVNSTNLGAGTMDICLYHHFLSTHPALSQASFGHKSRSSQRLLNGCKKLKHLLSMLSEGSVTVESIGKNDEDVQLFATRDLLAKLCEESIIQFKALIEKCIEKAGGLNALNDIASVEVTGGGCRVPIIQDTIRECMGKKGDDAFAFSKSLDDTSLALGAAMIGQLHSSISADGEPLCVSPERQEQRETLLNDETLIAERDTMLIQKDEVKNQIEAHILELRSARHSKYSTLLPTSEEFTTYLDSTDDWLFSDECDKATLDEMTKKWNEIKTKTDDICADYLEAKRLDAERIEREMEQEAKQAAMERVAEVGDDGDTEDHDTRKLPTKRRMEIVMKNKAEASELFGDGNYKFAAARYSKALSHCNKFFDLSPDDEKEVNEVKLTLYLNMALCYIKMDKYDNAFQSCNEALALDSKNVKALFRRATVQHHRRQFDLALKDLTQAELIAPEDKAVKKLKRQLDRDILMQKRKEQAMAKKMFG